MICGILTPLICITLLPAVVLGHIALSQIKRSNGALGGTGQAKAGLWLGYGSLALFLLAGLLAPLFIRSQQKAQEEAYLNNVRQIGTALMAFHQDQGTDTAPYPSDIRQLDPMGYTTNVSELLAVRKLHAGDWYYFWSADAEDPSAALLISPPLKTKPSDVDANHILLTTAGAVRTVEPYVVDAALKASPEPPVKVPAPVR
jgi:type II secretory pathway pseudopilin PulG